MTVPRSFLRVVAAFALATLITLPGCILIRSTEHRISVNEDGTGEAVLRLIDLRSDETVDSLVQRDFRILLSSYEKEGEAEFSKHGRTITAKKLYTRADTLYAEVGYRFESLLAIEGLHVTDTELYIVVPPSRHVLRTNGSVQPWPGDAQRIVWKRDARRLLFQISENELPPSTSLARLYSAYE